MASRTALAAPFGDTGEPLAPQCAEHPFERRLGFGARTVARERLFGALEFPDLQEIDVDAQFLGEEAIAVDHLSGDSDALDPTRGAHPNAIAPSSRDPHARVAVAIGVANDLLVRFAKLAEQSGQLFGVRPSEARRPEAEQHPVRGPARRLFLGAD